MIKNKGKKNEIINKNRYWQYREKRKRNYK